MTITRIEMTERLEAMPRVRRELLACDFVGRSLGKFERMRPDDRRPRNAIEAKRRRVRGAGSNAELAQARQAALQAAEDTVWDAPRDATGDDQADAVRAREMAAACSVARAAAMVCQATLRADDVARSVERATKGGATQELIAMTEAAE